MMLEVAGGTPSKRKVAGAPPETKTVIAFSLAPGREARRHQARRRSRSARTLEALGFAVEGKGATVEGDGAELAARHPRRRRSRRGGRAHRRPRQGALGADAALARRGARRADRDPAPRAPRAPHAGGRGLGRGHHLVVHPARQRAQAFGGGQDALELANPISTRDVVDASEPAAGPARRRAAQPQPRLCRLGPVRGGAGLSRRRAQGPVHRRFRRARRRCGARGCRPPLGGAGARTPACSKPRPTWSRCWPSSASMPPRRR